MLKNFAAWLYKPYLDLSSPHQNAPLHTFGVEFDYLNLEKSINLPRIQSVLMPSFRLELILEARNLNYALACPLELQKSFRTERWDFFCKKTEIFSKLSKDEQIKTAWLMNKLCFYNNRLVHASFKGSNIFNR